MNKIVIYSALIGDLDNFIEPKFDIPNCDLILFTNNPDIKVNKFKVIYIDTDNEILKDYRKLARMIKTMPHLFIPQYEISVWIDSRLDILRPDIAKMASDYLKDSDFAVFKHFHRDTLWQEHEEIIKRKKANPYKVIQQMDEYIAEGFKEDTLLAETTSIIRRHMHPSIIKFDEMWWKEINQKSIRDQMSFPYVYWRLPETRIKIMDGFVWDNKYFKMGSHNVNSKTYTGVERKVKYMREFTDYLQWARKYFLKRRNVGS